VLGGNNVARALIIAGTALLLVTGCSRMMPGPTARYASLPPAEPVRHRADRAHPPARAGGVDPFAALSRAAALRTRFESRGPTNFAELDRPTGPSSPTYRAITEAAREPGTTGSLGARGRRAAPVEDAEATMRRVEDAGRSAAKSICRGC
jgi:hypothetical protein